MTSSRDELWVDMVQFDTTIADQIWDGDARDPDNPRWYDDVRALIRRARGPGEPDELVDEPVLVDTMHRAARGATITRLPRRSGVRMLGRVVAMKAAAATTASVVSVAAAAATTGIVATVAATVVVPVLNEHVVPIIEDRLTPAVVMPDAPASERSTDPSICAPAPIGCDAQPTAPVLGDVLAPAPPAPAPAVAGEARPIADAGAAAARVEPVAAGPVPVVTAPVATEPVATEPVVTEPVVTKPVVTKPAVTGPVDPGAVAPRAKPVDPGAVAPRAKKAAAMDAAAPDPVLVEPAPTGAEATADPSPTDPVPDESRHGPHPSSPSR
jgi:hypothetical protein